MGTEGHVARFVVRPGERDKALAVLRPMFEQVQNEPETLLYLMHVPKDEPDTIWFYERYTDEAGFTAHLESDVHQAVVEKLLPLLAAEPEITHLELLAAKGLPALPDSECVAEGGVLAWR